MTRQRLLLGAFLAVIPVAASETPAGQTAQDGFKHFITRDGDRLMEGDRVFRFVGVNMPGLNLPYDYFYGIPERMVLPTPWEQEDGFKTMVRMGLTCVRTWNLPIASVGEKNATRFKYVLGPARFNDKAFVAIDHMLALANKYRVRVIFSLTADCGDFLGGIGDYAAHRGKPRAAFFSDPQIKEDYKATLRYVLTRRNTVTGNRYSEDKAILAWQFGNEMDGTKPGESVQRAWQAEMAACIKKLDTNHLIAYGRRFLPDDPDPNIDIIVNHYYGGDWLTKVKEDRAKTKGKRPYVVTEFGLESDPAKIAAMLDAVIESDVSGAMIWSMFFHHRDGGFWHHGIITKDGAKSYHWPGFETGAKVNERGILEVMRTRAFRIRGMTPPPITAPDAPQLLPFTDAALFSWRGSAGASSYVIQRAPAPGGPWTTIAENVSDTVPCYRPLFADSSARPGEAWCYRVIAKNDGGPSSPSNVVGPVKIRRAVLADELKTFDLTADHSPGVTLLDNDNYHFAEHYYRASGKAGDWLLYRAPDGQQLDRFSLSAWNPATSPGLRVLVSASGKDWQDVTPSPKVLEYKPYYAKGRWAKIRATEHRIGSDSPPAGMRLLRIEWPDKALLDRVELHFRRAQVSGRSTPSPEKQPASTDQPAFPTKDLAQTAPSRFDVHVNDLSDDGVPVIRPWKTIKLDPDYRGGWLVVGDLTGDRTAELVSARNGVPARDVHYTSSVVVHRLDGSVLWKWGNPDARNALHHDVACQIHDLDGDGHNEVVVAADRRVVVLEGTTGRELRHFEIPPNASDCITFCNVSGRNHATDMLVKTRYGQIWAYDVDGKLLWTVEKPGGYRTSHQPFPIDLDGDGRDEIIAGFAALNHDGSLRWQLPQSICTGGHADSIRLFRDADRPADKRLLLTHCGGNRMDMLDGNGKVYWSVTGLHFESVFSGELDKDRPGPEIVVDIAHQPWGKQPLLILDEDGNLLGRYMTMRSRQHRLVDWFGTGQDLIFCGQTRALLDAQGRKRARFETPMPEGARDADAPERLGYMIHLADVTGDGRPDLVVNTVPGSAVWIYKNERGAKNLSRERLTMPVNATLY